MATSIPPKVWLESYKVPVEECSVTRELYGYCKPVLNWQQVRADVYLAGYRDEEHEWLTDTIEAQFEWSVNNA